MVGQMTQILFIIVFVVYFFLSLGKRERDWAIILLPLFFPTYLIKTEFFGVPFTMVEMVIYGCFLAVVATAVYRVVNPLKWWNVLFSSVSEFVHPRKSFFAVYGWLVPAVGLFVLAALFSLIITSSEILMINGETVFFGMKTALGILKGWIIAPILMFLLLLLFIDDNEKVVTMTDIYTVSAVLLSLWGVFQLLSGVYVTPDARVSGPFDSANYLALYIGPAVTYVLIRLSHVMCPLEELEKHSFWKIPTLRNKVPMEKPETFLLMVALLVLVPVLVATKSYGAMIAVGVALFLYFVLAVREFRLKIGKEGFPWKFFAGIIVVIAIFAGITYNADPVKWNSVFAFDDRNSSSVRLEVYQISGELIWDNWFTGIGMGQYPAYYQLEARDILGHDPYEWNMLHPHNLFIAMWLNMGLLGLIAFVWILYLAVKRVWPVIGGFAYREIEHGAKIRVVGMIMLIEILVHGLLDTPFFKNDLALLFWLVIAIIFTADNERKIDG